MREDERKRTMRDQKKIVALPIPAIPVSRSEVKSEDLEEFGCEQHEGHLKGRENLEKLRREEMRSKKAGLPLSVGPKERAL